MSFPRLDIVTSVFEAGEADIVSLVELCVESLMPWGIYAYRLGVGFL
jgi:hypothetical protein